VEVLLRAYAGLKGEVPLVLIGRAVDDFSGMMLPNVMMLHNWPHGVVMAAWRRCALGVVPSLCADACPTVAMEAMAMGRAVIASRVGGLPDIVADGETGLLVPVGNVATLREAMESLLVDVRRREDMGAMGRQRVGAFRASTVVPRIEGVYEEVLRR
jgi:glycosyltransferase involved in cell wall biosynthesis